MGTATVTGSPNNSFGFGGSLGGTVTTFGETYAAKPEGSGGGNGGGGGGGKGGGGDDGDGGDDGGGTALLSSYTSIGVKGDAAIDFNVEIIFKGGGWTESLQNIFIAAADYLSTIITGDIADVFFRGKVIDDIKIDAKITSIDDEGGILGQAGPTAYRTSNFLPATAIMEFDVADVPYYEGIGLFDDIVLHEMLHCIGFGTMWGLMGLTSGSIADGSLTFNGENANAAYAVEFPKLGGEIPIEMDGGSGTAGGHWDDATFGNELMTGYINTSGNYISAMTIAALEDMKYETIWNPGDPSDVGNVLPDPIDSSEPTTDLFFA